MLGITIYLSFGLIFLLWAMYVSAGQSGWFLPTPWWMYPLWVVFWPITLTLFLVNR